MLKCSCGRDHTLADHHAEVAADAAAVELRRRSLTSEFEAYSNEFIEATLVKACSRRTPCAAASCARWARARPWPPLPACCPWPACRPWRRRQRARWRRTNLKIGFIPITCATPLIMAHPLGFYKKQGLNVEVTKTAGWALIRDKMMNKEYDATHFLSPMPLAISDGPGLERDAHERGHHPEHQRPGHHAGQQAQGQPRPEELEGLQVRIPFEYSMHNFLLRYYLAEHG
jgi:nitrate/nitrite transport system substrate-binding protein